MTLYDALMIFGKLADICNIRIEELVAERTNQENAIFEGENKEEKNDAKIDINLSEEIKRLMLMREIVRMVLSKHITHFSELDLTDPFSYKINNEKEVQSLQKIFRPEVQEKLMKNDYIKAAFMLRKAVNELLINEKDFVTNCEKIKFDKLNIVLQKYEQ